MSNNIHIEALRMAREIISMTNDDDRDLRAALKLAGGLSHAFSTGDFSLAINGLTGLSKQIKQVDPISRDLETSENVVGDAFALSFGDGSYERPDQGLAGRWNNDAHKSSSSGDADGESTGELATPPCADRCVRIAERCNPAQMTARTPQENAQ